MYCSQRVCDQASAMKLALFLPPPLYRCVHLTSGWISPTPPSFLSSNKLWAWNIVMTSCVFSVPFFIIWSTVNSVAWYQGSTQALPATTIVLLIVIWLIVGFPLTVVGGILGKNSASKQSQGENHADLCPEREGVIGPDVLLWRDACSSVAIAIILIPCRAL